jgi:hypothetical protein
MRMRVNATQMKETDSSKMLGCGVIFVENNNFYQHFIAWNYKYVTDYHNHHYNLFFEELITQITIFYI